MQKTLKEIAGLIGGKLAGDEAITIKGVAGIKEAQEGEITFVANPKYFSLIHTTCASAIIAPEDLGDCSLPVIRVENPSLAFAKVVSFFAQSVLTHPKGIHPSAILGKGVLLGKDVAIGPYAVIDEEACIGDEAIIYPGCFVGRYAKIGSHSLIYANVSIRERVTIGSRVIIHSGAVIGSDGFGFVTIEDGSRQKIPQTGTVEIGDDVEIGANVAIDRARFEKTVIGKGTKIDNLVQIAHNVIVGDNSIIVAQAGISGSTVIGRGVTIAGQAGLAGHISVGESAVIAAQAGVTKSVPANTIVSGYPAKPHETAKRINACVQNLPKLYEEVKRLNKKIEELESKTKDK